jgi:hypothetical protein
MKQGHLIAWNGLAQDAINKNLRITPATAMGHMGHMNQKDKTFFQPARKCRSHQTWRTQHSPLLAQEKKIFGLISGR